MVIDFQYITNKIFKKYQTRSSTHTQVYRIAILIVTVSEILLDTAFDTAHPLCLVASGSLLATYKLCELMEDQKMLPFREAYLSDRNGDLKKRWYINFYVWDVQENKMVRKQDYSVNDYDTAAERYAYSEIRIEQINEKLKQGFHIDRLKSKEQVIKDTGMSIVQALTHALTLKNNALATYNSYKSEVDLFCRFLGDKQHHGINSLTKTDVYRYIDASTKDQLAGKTINSKISYLSGLTTRLMKRNIVNENPFVGIDKEKEVVSARNLAYNDAEIQILSDIIPKNNIELWHFVQLIYYTFMRPNEIRQMQVYNILLSKKQIFIDAYKSKNKKSEYIMIPDGAVDTLIELIKGKSSNDYLFSGQKTSSPVSKNRMTDRHLKILNTLNFNKNHTLYAWKHTGVVKAFLAGVNIKSIQLQCRHYSIAETDKYLKSLGLFDNFDFQLKMPSLPK